MAVENFIIIYAYSVYLCDANQYAYATPTFLTQQSAAITVEHYHG